MRALRVAIIAEKKIHNAGFMYAFIYNARYILIRMNHQKMQAFYCFKKKTLKFS